jgi:hypothetical protein
MNFGNDARRPHGRFAAYLSFVALITALASSAQAAEQCRFIETRADREACYQRQEAARTARQKAQETQQAAQPKAYEPMDAEDAQLARAIRGICRGC